MKQVFILIEFKKNYIKKLAKKYLKYLEKYETYIQFFRTNKIRIYSKYNLLRFWI